MSAIISGNRRAGRAGRASSARPPRASRRVRRTGAAQDAFQAGLHNPAAAVERTAQALSQATGCAVIITERDGPGAEAHMRAEAWPRSPQRPPALGFISAAARRIAARSRALTLRGDGGGPLPRGWYYLGLPAPRLRGARWGLHLISRSPFSRRQREAARQAADALGREQTSQPATPPGCAPDASARVAGLRAAESGPVAIEQLLSDALQAAAETLGADTCSLMVTEGEQGPLVVDAAYGLDEGIIRDPRQRTSPSIAQYVMARGEPVILGDPHCNPDLRGLGIERRPGIRSAICVPIALREGLRGVVSFNRIRSSEPFREDDLRLASTVAAQLGPCVANARRYEQAAQRLDQLAVLSQVGESVTVATDPQQVAQALAVGAARAAGVERCRIYLEQGGALALTAWHGYPPGAQPTPDVAPAGGAIAQAAASGRAILVGRGRRDPAARFEVMPGAKVKAFAAVPITWRGRSLGVLCADCADAAALGALDLGLVERLLAGAAGALDNAMAQQRLREHLDDLYRLYDAVQRINTSLEPDDIVRSAARGVKLLTGCRKAAWIGLGARWGEKSSPAVQLHPGTPAHQAACAISTALLLEPTQPPRQRGLADLAARVWSVTQGERSLVVPVADRAGGLGLIVGWQFEGRPRERAAALAGALCTHAATVLRQALDYEAALSERSLELSALYRLCEEISAATSFESALRSVLEIAHSMVRYDEGLVFIWNEAAQRLELAACRGVEPATIQAQAPQAQPGNMYQWVFREGKAFISTDMGRHAGNGRGGWSLRSSMAVPLVVGNETIGVLAVHSVLPRAYNEQQVKVLSIVASQAAAIYRALQSLGRLGRYTDNILESIPAGVIGLDREGKVVMWSAAAGRILGVSAAEAAGADFLNLAHRVRDAGAGTLASLALTARRVLARGEAVTEHELRMERPEAPPRTLLASCTPLRGAEGQLLGAVLLIEDISDRKRMEEQMRQMSQLAAVGHLAANVAHEIRNPLSAVKTAAQFLSTECGQDPLVAQFCGIIDEECDRLSKVTSDFLTYARPNEPALERVSLAAVVESAIAATAADRAQRAIRLSWRAPRRLPRAWLDPGAMHRVFVNLLINAAQAIGHDGEIAVRLRTCRSEQGTRMIEATVSDTGPGIPEQNLERIWTPFFTTKTKGAGLGLSIVRKTVEAHAGQAWVECPGGGGAVFRLRLPLDGRSAGTRKSPARASAAERGSRWRQLDLFADQQTPVNNPAPGGEA